MGDRGNIVVSDGQSAPVFLYTHWCGSEIPMILQRALKRGKGRWGDTSYLTRIIFSEMIRGDLLESTGYGISTSMCDNEHNILFLDDVNHVVKVLKHTWGKELEDLTVMAEFKYEKFLELNFDKFDPYYCTWKLDESGRLIHEEE